MSVTPLPAQRMAIEAPLGPTLVIAGPGAGKTFCLIGRVEHLIKQHGFAPSQLCAVTFTNLRNMSSEYLQEVAASEGLETNFSFGVTSLTEHAIRDTDDMFRKSVKALEEAKKEGPGSLVIYDFRTMPLEAD